MNLVCKKLCANYDQTSGEPVALQRCDDCRVCGINFLALGEKGKGTLFEDSHLALIESRSDWGEDGYMIVEYVIDALRGNHVTPKVFFRDESVAMANFDSMVKDVN
jgi:hypothetical protein